MNNNQFAIGIESEPAYNYVTDSPWAKFLELMKMEELEASDGIVWLEFADVVYEIIADELRANDTWKNIEETYFERGRVVVKLDGMNRIGIVGYFGKQVDTTLDMVSDDTSITALIEWVQDGTAKDFPLTKKEEK